MIISMVIERYCRIRDWDKDEEIRYIDIMDK